MLSYVLGISSVINSFVKGAPDAFVTTSIKCTFELNMTRER